MKKFIILIITIGLLSGGYFYIRNKPNEEVITISDEIYLIIEDEIIEYGNPVIYEDDIIYLSFDFITKYIDPNLFYDKEEKIVVFTSNTNVKRFKLDENIGSINSKEYKVDNPIFEYENQIYIPIDIFMDDYDVEINYFDNTKALVIDYTDMDYLEGEVILENPVIRYDMDKKAPIVNSNLEMYNLVNVYGEYEEWLKIRTKDGVPGFIKKKYIKLNLIKDKYKNELIEKAKSYISMDEKINLTWDYTYARVKFTDNIKPIQGVNIVSPTWFSVLDIEGNIQDKGNRDYVKKYLDIGYDLWPLVDNSFDPDLTHELLKSTKTREIIISKLLDIYLDYGFQGINIDFENVYYEDKDLLTQFMRELYPIFKENDMTVSMDITTISTSENWSMCYDRVRLQDVVDYFMLMAYDQHWASSPIAGSVAEYSWVESGIKGTLKMIPNEKLILAIPFYTRLWTIEGDTLSSKSITMDKANEFISSNDIQTVWNEDSGQYYGELSVGNLEYKIWLEDEKSLNYKISLVHKYNLAGIASWRKGYETTNIWDSIDKKLN